MYANLSKHIEQLPSCIIEKQLVPSTKTQKKDLVLLFTADTYPPSLLDYYSFVAGVNVMKFPSCSTGQGLASNIKELQSDIDGHNPVWLMVQPGGDPQVLNLTIQTLNNASYNETFQRAGRIFLYTLRRQLSLR